VEHSVTSAYNPRTNGQTKRFFATLMESLRKYCDEERDNWPNRIPFVLMAYLTKLNTSTHFTPYELLFGREMNNFENWQSQPKNSVNETHLN
jgi:hypothetical protein